MRATKVLPIATFFIFEGMFTFFRYQWCVDHQICTPGRASEEIAEIAAFALPISLIAALAAHFLFSTFPRRKA